MRDGKGARKRDKETKKKGKKKGKKKERNGISLTLTSSSVVSSPAFLKSALSSQPHTPPLLSRSVSSNAALNSCNATSLADSDILHGKETKRFETASENHCPVLNFSQSPSILWYLVLLVFWALCGEQTDFHQKKRGILHPVWRVCLPHRLIFGQLFFAVSFHLLVLLPPEKAESNWNCFL